MAHATISALDELRLLSPVGIALSTFVLGFSVTVYRLIYNAFFHPLKYIPGPLIARSCGIPYALHTRSGTTVSWLKELHDIYGDAVRLAPNEVSFISGATAWPRIYGPRIGKYKHTGPYLKDVAAVPTPLNGVRNLLSNNEADHARVRRTLSPAFSDKALRDQEALLQQHINLLVFRLGEHAAESKPVDLTRWYNYASFDIICDLAFGEPLYCLRDSTEHMWIRLVTMSIQALALLSVKTKYPIFAYWDALKDIFKDTSARERARRDFFHVVSDKVTRRLAKDTDRPDFFSPILRNQESQARALSRDEMDSNALLFLSAGSETTATALAGTTYLLLSNRDKYARLVREIRSRFSSAGDITLDEVSRLEYMNACIQEGLRYYPPIATGFPRIVPAGGDRISGKYIPEGTAVYVSQHAANHSERNFREPEEYVPERWMGDEEYRDDVRESVNPFSFGPRNCLGKNLAYAEMRLVIAQVLFNFDLELVDKKQDWFKGQRVFTVWDKPSLMVKLTPVQR